jgi:hypothetical protein
VRFLAFLVAVGAPLVLLWKGDAVAARVAAIVAAAGALGWLVRKNVRATMLVVVIGAALLVLSVPEGAVALVVLVALALLVYLGL